MEMGEAAGISKQREGQVSSSETVGGVERSNLQSSHITEYWFMQHEQCKIRVLECFLETAKVALKGKNLKVQNILDDQSIEILNMDDEEFERKLIDFLTSGKIKLVPQLLRKWICFDANIRYRMV